MLCLTREEEESIVIIVPPGDKPRAVHVKLIGALGKVRLGITADECVKVWRSELLDGTLSPPPPPAVPPTRPGESV